MTSEQKFEIWAIVEVMGHKRFAGYVTEQTFGSASMIRVDVPEIDDVPAFTKMFGVGSIYCITPCTEEAAKSCQRSWQSRAFSAFDIPALPSPSAVVEDYDDDLDEDRPLF